MIDLHTACVLTLAEAARTLPKMKNRHPHPATLYRWATHGVYGVKLDHIRIGQKLATTREALAAFLEAVKNVPRTGTAPKPKLNPPKSRTAAQRERAIVEANRRLDAMGI